MDDPELTATIEYDAADDDSEAGTLVLHVSRNKDEAAKAEATEDEDDDEEVACYARVGDSAIVYTISYSDYESLTEVSYDDLRHREVFAGSFDLVEAVNELVL